MGPVGVEQGCMADLADLIARKGVAVVSFHSVLSFLSVYLLSIRTSANQPIFTLFTFNLAGFYVP